MAEYVEFDTPKGPKLYKIGKFSFSNVEFAHLSIAFLILALTLFARNVHIMSSDVSGQIIGLLTSSEFLFEFSAFMLAFGFGFILHEFAHKLVAQHYGFVSEFRADMFMLVAMFILAWVSPIIFLAPGAVIILTRHISKKQNGIISVAGPLINLILAVIGIILALIFTGGFMSIFAMNLIWINAYLGIFNMIPLWVLDGRKVLAWNKPVYFSLLSALLLILILVNIGYF